MVMAVREPALMTPPAPMTMPLGLRKYRFPPILLSRMALTVPWISIRFSTVLTKVSSVLLLFSCLKYRLASSLFATLKSLKRFRPTLPEADSAKISALPLLCMRFLFGSSTRVIFPASKASVMPIQDVTATPKAITERSTWLRSSFFCAFCPTMLLVCPALCFLYFICFSP